MTLFDHQRGLTASFRTEPSCVRIRSTSSRTLSSIPPSLLSAFFLLSRPSLSPSREEREGSVTETVRGKTRNGPSRGRDTRTRKTDHKIASSQSYCACARGPKVRPHGMDSLLESATTYVEVLRNCSSPKVAHWKQEDLERAVNWAEYFQRVGDIIMTQVLRH